MEKNIDLKCAEYGNKIITEIKSPRDKKKIESMISKALGVLQEDGLYAFSVYVKAKRDGKSTEEITAGKLFEIAFDLLKDNEVAIISKNATDFNNSIRTELANDLDRLLFAKELLERTLIYARYHAKALSGREAEKESE
jgi:hypothetical protein